MIETYKGPTDNTEQTEVKDILRYDKHSEETLQRAESLHSDILQLLEDNNIVVSDSSYRLKSPERIAEKLERSAKHNKGHWPISDIYGERLVFPNKDSLNRTIKLLKERYPTPETFPWGLRSIRRKGNRYSDPDYEITRMNILFNHNRIAEIQLLTEDQAILESNTRNLYTDSQKR